MCCLCIIGCFFLYTHTYTTTLSGTKYLCSLIGIHCLRHIDEDIASILHQVLFLLTEESLSCAVYLLNCVQWVIGHIRTEIDEGIIQERLVIASLCVTIFVEVSTEVQILIVIHTICTTVYLLHASLNILCIC